MLACIFFNVQNYFPTIGRIACDRNRIIVKQSNNLIDRLEENFEIVMDNYYEYFKAKMKNRMRIPKFVVDKDYDEICFKLDIDFVYV